MQRRLILLLIFMSASLAAMKQEGMWDEYGNYLGPSDQAHMEQPYVPQMMMVPQLVYMPVYVDQFGQQMPFMPHMSHAMPYHPPFGMMPHQFPMTYQPPQFIELPSDQWAAPAPAPVQNVGSADAQVVVQVDDRTTPQPQAAVSSFSTASTTSADVEKPVGGDLVQPTSAVAHVVPAVAAADEDTEVKKITEGMERASIDDQANQTNKAPILHWADVQDSPSPEPVVVMAQVADDKVIQPDDQRSAQTSSSSSSVSSTASVRTVSPHAKPAALSFLQVATQKRNNNAAAKKPAPRDQVSSSSTDATKRSASQRLEDLLAQWRTSEVTDKVQQLTQNKFNSINALRYESDRMSEWEKLAQLFEQSGGFSQQVTQQEQATFLFGLANMLVENAKKIDKKLSVRRRFARLAIQCVENASAVLPAHLVAQASDISTQAVSLIPNFKNGVKDQTDVPEDEFYKGYTFASEQPEASRANAAKAVASKVPKSAPIKPVKKAAPKKSVPHPKAQSVKSSKKQEESVSRPAQQKTADPLALEKRIEKLLHGNKAQFKEGFSLLEQIAEGTIPDVDPQYRIRAMRRVADVYLYGYIPDNSETVFVPQDLARAEYFMSKALDTDNNVSDLQYMLLLVFEQGRQKVDEYSNRLETHANADDNLKRSARVLRAAAHLMDDEQGQLAGDALKEFRKIHDGFTFNESMVPVIDILPKSFCEWMYTRIPVWQNDLARKSDLDEKAEAKAEWLYLMGRLYVDGGLKGSSRLNELTRYAIGWIKAAATAGNPRAQLYLAKPASNSQPTLCRYDRMHYLRSALASDKPRGIAEREYAERVCEQYAREGFLAPLTDYLCLRKNAERLDDALDKLKNNFPAIRISGGEVTTFVVAQESGLIDELKKRAPDSWVARSMLSALEIAQCRDSDMKISGQTIAQIDNALARIQADVQDHPQLESLVAACYSTRAFVTKRISSEVSFGTLDQGIQLMKGVYRDYEESIKRGDIFGKVSCGTLFLKTNIALIQKASGANGLYEKGLALLHEVANGQDGEYKFAVLEFLINHYSEQQDWYQVDKYLASAHQYAFAIYRDDCVQAVVNLKKTIQEKRTRNAQLNPRDARKLNKTRLAVQKVQSAQNGEIIQQLKQADECVVSALRKARTNPFEALRDLRKMKELNVQRNLGGNPRMIALCYMALDDMCAAAADEELIKSSARGVFLKTLDPFYHMMGQASLEYQEKSSKPDYKKDKFEELLRAYLEAYHLKERVDLYIKAVRADDSDQTLKQFALNNDNIASMMSLWTPEQQEEYLQICKDDANTKRAAYQAAIDEEAAALKAILEKL